LGEEERIKAWVGEGLTVTKVNVLLARRGVEVPYRALARFATERCGAGKPALTVRVADPDPGQELQVDFGRMGLVPDGERKRVCHALIFTACWSRHCFVHLCFSQTTEETINGFEEAWVYFGGVFPIVIPDNMSSVVTEADATDPRFNDTFIEYAQSRGFEIDPARVRHPKDKPKVERAVQYVRGNFFAGEVFVDLDDARRRALTWCTQTAGLRVHGSTLWRPAEAFRATEAPCCAQCRALPTTSPYGRGPKSTVIFTVRWPVRSTPCPIPWWASTCAPGPTPRRSSSILPASWSKSTPGWHRGGARPTRPISHRAR
jgi:transposase